MELSALQEIANGVISQVIDQAVKNLIGEAVGGAYDQRSKIADLIAEKARNIIENDPEMTTYLKKAIIAAIDKAQIPQPKRW